jgi:two-component system, OmpR family, phosphate regulon response regulator PhoB
MTAAKILVVEDERPIRDMIGFGLRRRGFTIIDAENCATARMAVVDQRPDLLIIDWMLPDGSGLELTRQLKRERDTAELPIIMLTARAEEADKVAGLDGGADDYITKPFSPRELLSRVNALLRRTRGGAADQRLQVGPLALDRASMRVTANDRPVELGPTEYRLLEFLMSHPERVYSREHLLERVRTGNTEVELRTVDVQIRRLRAALEPVGADHVIQTVRGAGYRLAAARGD